MTLFAPFALSLLPATFPAPATTETWRLPPQEVVDLVDAAPPPSVRLSPDARWMLLSESPALPSLAEVARPWVGLAGLRIDPANNGRNQTWFETSLALRGIADAEARPIELPERARIGRIRWSHTSRHFAFTLVHDDRIELWTADVASAKAARVVERLNGVFGDGFTWMPDGEHLLVRRIPDGRAPAPEEPAVASGPAVMETTGDATPVRTYQDMLASPHDEELFAHFATSQLSVVPVGGGEARDLGEPGMHMGATPSPDGSHVLVTTLNRPFSYVMPYWRFPQVVEVWNADGGGVRRLTRIPMGEGIPIGGVQRGPRSHAWKATDPATIVCVEALDGGDPKNEAEHRDHWLALSAPFEGNWTELLKTEHRATGLTWMKDPTQVLVSEYDRDRRWTRTTMVDLDAGPDAEPLVVDDRSARDRYGDPGRPVTEVTTRGTRVVRQDGERIYRTGSGASEDGARPFLDSLNLATGETERLWRCSPGSYERVVAMAITGSDRSPSFVTVYESPEEPPNYLLRDLQDGSVRRLTDFADPTPELRGIHKELVTYERDDGVQLSATLYLPADYEEGTRLPLVVWAYPLEYNDPKTAGQVGGTPYRFTRIRGYSHLFFLTQGYAVLDGATMPIVGDPETMNDTFIEQIVAAARAAIEVAVQRGVADPDRVGVGGHSYGAFMTANLLAHSDLFSAGIARSGAYNRTLTPFGFQSERRTLWEAPESYARISPFFHADKINEPLLMVHGERDANSGTYPMQSERLFQAIKGNGGTARLVMLPAENHGYRARESVLHTLAEMIDWFGVHVKGSAPVEARYEHEEQR